MQHEAAIRNHVLEVIKYFIHKILHMREAWVAQSLSLRLLILAQIMISGRWDRAPHWALHLVWSLLEILSLCPFPCSRTHVLSK